MIEINLIPDVKRELLKAQRARSLVISGAIVTSIAAVGVVVMLSIFLFGVQFARGASLDSQITSKGDELSKVENLSEVLTIQSQLEAISALNSDKIMSSRLFSIISAVTPTGEDGVEFSQINLAPAGLEAGSVATVVGPGAQTASGQIRLEGQTRSYDSMEAFKKRIENTSFVYKDGDEEKTTPLASNINVTDISYGESAVGQRVLRFTVSFDYPAELLGARIDGKSLSFKLVVNGNVTDSYLGIPRFTERANDIKAEN